MGDLAAARSQLSDLVARYARLVRSVIRKVAGKQADRIADDAEQRVLIALWKQLEGERIIEHPASYLYRSAVRETVRMLRGEARVELHEVADDTIAEPAGGPEAAVGGAELAGALERALASLRPDRERAARGHLAGFSVEEIMRLYGWSYQKARNLIARGMADLRDRLRAEGIDEG